MSSNMDLLEAHLPGQDDEWADHPALDWSANEPERQSGHGTNSSAGQNIPWPMETNDDSRQDRHKTKADNDERDAPFMIEEENGC